MNLIVNDYGAEYFNYPIPSVEYPNNLIAAYWRDLNPGAGGAVYFKDFGDRAIIQYEQVTVIDLPPEEATNTFGTIGIENADGTNGLQVSFNDGYLHDGLAVKINPAIEWLGPIPSSGIVVPGQTCDVHVFFKSYELGGGTYDGVLNVYHNAINQQPFVQVRAG